MKNFVLIVLVGGTLCLTGCLSTEVATSNVSGVEHIYSYDYGWKLFNWIPICRYDITPERVQKALFDEAHSRGKDVETLVYHNYDSVLMEIPILAFTVPIPYLITYHEIQLSGVLK